MLLDDPAHANLLALCVHRLAQRAARPLPHGTILLASDRMKARVIVDENPRVVSGAGSADCTIEADLDTLLEILSYKGRLLPRSVLRVKVRGKAWKALALLRAIRC
jgi:hypothetical protein